MKKIFAIILILTSVCFAARIEQGDTSRKVSFVAVDATDYVTRETLLTNVTVYYSVDGGTATAMTTPTATAADGTNMPGVFWLNIDEAGMVALASGVDESELTLHVTATEMAPVTLSVDVYRNASNVTEWLGTACATPTTAGVPEVDMTHINGGATNGYNATLSLKALNVINSTGTAVVFGSNDGEGLSAYGTTAGVELFSAAGIGLNVISTTGKGFEVNGAVNGTIEGNITGNVTGNLSGSIGSLGTQAKADVRAESQAAVDINTPPTDYSPDKTKAIMDWLRSQGYIE